MSRCFLKAFCFLNINNFLVAWETYSGELISVNATKLESPARPMSIFEASRFRNNHTQWYVNERYIDEIRKANFSEKNSRFTSLYFFENFESAKKASEDGRWGDGYYDLDYLTEVEITSDSTITKVDHEWIFEKNVPNIPITSDDWITKYWKGVPFSSEPLWELLVEGRAKIFNDDLRERAFEIVKQLQPKTLGVLELSRIARNAGSQLGHSVAWVSRKNENTGIVQYIIKNKDDEMEDAIKTQIQKEKSIKPEFGLERFIPDLRNESFDVPVPPSD